LGDAEHGQPETGHYRNENVEVRETDNT
jgi:hypothetical protein